jgi:formyltetrahydrofolate deformylase
LIQYILTLSCQNRQGIVAAVATTIFEHGANIREAQQFDDTESGRFFARIVLDHPKNSLDAARLGEALGAVAERFAMTWVLRDRAKRHRVLLLVSRFDHCLADILYRWRIGEMPMDITAVVSNHPRDSLPHLDLDGVAFHHLPVTKETKAEQNWLSSPATCRCCRTIWPASWQVAASTSTTPSCPASRARNRIIRRISAG